MTCHYYGCPVAFKTDVLNSGAGVAVKTYHLSLQIKRKLLGMSVRTLKRVRDVIDQFLLN